MKYRKIDNVRDSLNCDKEIGSPGSSAFSAYRKKWGVYLLFRMSNLEISQNRSKAAFIRLISIGEGDIRAGRHFSADEVFEDFEKKKNE